MKRPKNRISPCIESLENIALLSTLPSVAATTGLGSVGSVTAADVQALQQDASGGFLEQYISEIELEYGRRGNVRQFAQSVIADHQTTSFDLQTTAGNAGVSLPTGIALPSDVRNAQQVLSAVKHGNVDQAYLKVMAQINAQDVASDQQLIASTQDAGVTAYAQETMAYDRNHLQGANQLSRRPKSTYNPTIPVSSINTPPTVITAASVGDVRALQQDASGGALEQFISQIEELSGSRSDVQQYAQSVVGDHQVTNYDLSTTASAAGVTLPSGITQQSDIQDARTVLDAVRRGKLDQTYLKVMARINAQDVTNDQQLIASTQNAGVSSYAQETMTYDMTHLQGAQKLLAHKGTTYTPGG